ncbi:MAG TPA: CsbD family protein [Anaerolineales bacterium]|nr:CsbD family protein [Anaerolineales bacterium]
MNTDVLEGKWKQLRGEIRETWGELTDDELDQIAGKRDKLAGILQEKYGWSREEADRQIDDFLRRYEVTDRV